MIRTWPSQYDVENAAFHTPRYVRSSRMPYAAYSIGALNAGECDEIIQYALDNHEPYNFPVCDAHETREMLLPLDKVFDAVSVVARLLNMQFFDFDIPDAAVAWMQTYHKGNRYDYHVDGEIGQSRKLTAVVMLSDPDDYLGGRLVLESAGRRRSFTTPNDRGTVVVFPPWQEHYVSQVFEGVRHTINMGFYGPPFK